MHHAILREQSGRRGIVEAEIGLAQVAPQDRHAGDVAAVGAHDAAAAAQQGGDEMAALHQRAAELAADEPGRAGDEDAFQQQGEADVALSARSNGRPPPQPAKIP